MKKLLSWVLSLFMVCALLPVGVFAGTQTESDFDIRNGVLYKYKGTDAVVTVPDGVTEIRKYAFYENQTLKEVTLPDSVTTVGIYAFAKCKNLVNIQLSDAITTLDKYSIYRCESLTEIHLPDSLVEIGDNAFARCKKLEKIELPDGLEVVGSAAFSKTALKQVTIPASVTLVENYAFHSCKKLAEIVIPESFTNFYTDSFTDTAWYEKQYADKDFHILNGIVLGCSDAVKQQERVVFPDGITGIGANMFVASEYDPNHVPNETIVEVVLPDTVERFDKECFAWCRNLKTITIPDSVTELPVGMFQGCSSLEQIQIPAGVTKIGGNAFEYCRSLTEIVLPDGLTEIKNDLFHSCRNLEKVNIPDGVTKIGAWAFSSCDSLTEIVIPDSVTSLGNFAFFACERLEKITIPKTLTDIGSGAFGATLWSKNQLKENGIIIVNRVLLDVTPYNADTRTIHLPNGIISVVAEGSSYAKAVVVPPSVTDLSRFGYSDSWVYIMYGVKGSYAEQVAKERNMDFRPLALNKTSLSLSKGKSYQLKFNSGSEASWKSSNSKVVSVDQTGKLTAKASGTATITATLYGQKYTCKVTVSAKTYTVKRGDSLWSIAAKQLGDGRRYTEIMKLNGMKNTSIKVGQKLKLPQK